jgi:indole-3-glycerol phosphate synthase
MSGQRANVLQRIAARTRERCKEMREKTPLEGLVLKARAATEEGEPTFPFERSLKAPGMSFICECKKASPSKGLIADDYDPVRIAHAYEDAGAAAISCLTEPHFFEGDDRHLSDIARQVGVPVLRKDFVVDEYMIYQAKVLGADAVLLICSILEDEELANFVDLCHRLGLSALVEAYEPDEVPRAIEAGARVVGVNNRDLRTFSVDFGRSIDLRPLVGPDRIFVSESGVQTAKDVSRLHDAHVDAVLIGETLMRATDVRAALDDLRSEL